MMIMNIKFLKITLLKWIFLPVIICMRLIVVPIEGLILCIPLDEIFSVYYIYSNSELKANTIVEHKVRMNN